MICADISDAHHVTRASAGADLVFHLAANSSGTLSVINPRFDFENNALGTFNVVEAALTVGVRRFVYVSSASVYGVSMRFPIDEQHPTRPFVPYGASKLAGEVLSLALFHAFGLPVVAVRPFCVYGPGENPRYALVEVSRFLRWHLNDRPIQIVGDPDRKTRDFLHVDDLVAALLLIADRAPAGEVFNIGSGEEVSMRQLAMTIGKITGTAPRTEVLSHITDDTYRLVADTAKLRALGFAARIPLEEGIRRLAADLGRAPALPTGPTIFARGQHAEH
jgi:nucleoside-diphosphate-sugar epimerase